MPELSIQAHRTYEYAKLVVGISGLLYGGFALSCRLFDAPVAYGALIDPIPETALLLGLASPFLIVWGYWSTKRYRKIARLARDGHPAWATIRRLRPTTRRIGSHIDRRPVYFVHLDVYLPSGQVQPCVAYDLLPRNVDDPTLFRRWWQVRVHASLPGHAIVDWEVPPPG